MKNLLLLFISCTLFSLPVKVCAQTATFNVEADTISTTIVKQGKALNGIINVTANDLGIKYHAIASDFPADWLTPYAFGVCDNFLCRYNSTSGSIWNPSTATGGIITADYYSNGIHSDTGGFYLSLDLTSATTLGCYYITFNISDTASGYNKNITFDVCKTVATAMVPNVTNVENNILLYPNPANDELNVVFDANADVKNIAVYNIIGKVITVYKVTGDSANLDIENIPSGIYFVRLFNSVGNVVVTRKFTKQ